MSHFDSSDWSSAAVGRRQDDWLLNRSNDSLFSSFVSSTTSSSASTPFGSSSPSHQPPLNNPSISFPTSPFSFSSHPEPSSHDFRSLSSPLQSANSLSEGMPRFSPQSSTIGRQDLLHGSYEAASLNANQQLAYRASHQMQHPSPHHFSSNGVFQQQNQNQASGQALYHPPSSQHHVSHQYNAASNNNPSARRGNHHVPRSSRSKHRNSNSFGFDEPTIESDINFLLDSESDSDNDSDDDGAQSSLGQLGLDDWLFASDLSYPAVVPSPVPAPQSNSSAASRIGAGISRQVGASPISNSSSSLPPIPHNGSLSMTSSFSASLFASAAAASGMQWPSESPQQPQQMSSPNPAAPIGMLSPIQSVASLSHSAQSSPIMSHSSIMQSISSPLSTSTFSRSTPPQSQSYSHQSPNWPTNSASLSRDTASAFTMSSSPSSLIGQTMPNRSLNTNKSSPSMHQHGLQAQPNGYMSQLQSPLPPSPYMNPNQLHPNTNKVQRMQPPSSHMSPAALQQQHLQQQSRRPMLRLSLQQPSRYPVATPAAALAAGEKPLMAFQPASIIWTLPSWLHVRFFEAFGHMAISSRLPLGFTVQFSRPASIEFIKTVPESINFEASQSQQYLQQQTSQLSSPSLAPSAFSASPASQHRPLYAASPMSQNIQSMARPSSSSTIHSFNNFLSDPNVPIPPEAFISAEEQRIIETLAERLASFGPLELRTVTPYLSVTPQHSQLVLKKLIAREAARKEMVVYQPDYSESGKLVRILALGPRRDVRKGRNEVRALLQGTYHEQQLLPTSAISALPNDFIRSLEHAHSVTIHVRSSSASTRASTVNDLSSPASSPSTSMSKAISLDSAFIPGSSGDADEPGRLVGDANISASATLEPATLASLAAAVLVNSSQAGLELQPEQQQHLLQLISQYSASASTGNVTQHSDSVATQHSSHQQNQSSADHVFSSTDSLSFGSFSLVSIDCCCSFDARDAFSELRSACGSEQADNPALSLIPLPAVWLVYVRDVLWPQWAACGSSGAASQVVFGAHFMDARGQLSLTGPADQVEQIRVQVAQLLRRSRSMLTECVSPAEQYYTHHPSVHTSSLQYGVALYVDSRSRSIQLLTDGSNQAGMRLMRSVLLSNESRSLMAELPMASSLTRVYSWLRSLFPQLRVDRRDNLLRVAGRRDDVDLAMAAFHKEFIGLEGVWVNAQ